MLLKERREASVARGDLTILLADDHQLIREALKPYLRGLAANVTITEAADYPAVLQAAADAVEEGREPLVAVIDLTMPGTREDDPMAGLRDVCRILPNTAVVVFSASDDAATIGAALKAGARGYVPKSVHGRSVVAALRLVLEGEIYVPVEAMRSIATDMSAVPQASSPKDTLLEFLTSQELTSLRLLIQGLSNKAIARQMDLQVVTVKMHLRHAYRKIGATNRISAVRIALDHNLT